MPVFSTMLTPCGPLDGCVISMAVMLLTYSPSISMAGSGLAQEQGWAQLIKHLRGGQRTHGHTQVRKILYFINFVGCWLFYYWVPLDTS